MTTPTGSAERPMPRDKRARLAAARHAAHPPLRGEVRASSTASRRSAASCTSTSARRPSPPASMRACSRRTPSSPPTASTATRCCAASPMTRSWPRCTASSEGCSRGRGGSMHLFDARDALLRRQRHRRRRPAARRRAGAGRQAAAARRRVTACFFGEGAVAEGEFHESLNLAALWQLPVLFVCENNLYAMGTALARSAVADRPRAEGGEPTAWPAASVDGMDVLAVARGGARRRSAQVRAAQAPCSSSCAPTASARTRCSTPSSTATRPRSSAGRQRGPIHTFTDRLKAAGHAAARPSSRRIEREVARRGRGGGGRSPRPAPGSRSKTCCATSYSAGGVRRP